jgi:hypothetical protein
MDDIPNCIATVPELVSFHSTIPNETKAQGNPVSESLRLHYTVHRRTSTQPCDCGCHRQTVHECAFDAGVQRYRKVEHLLWRGQGSGNI